METNGNGKHEDSGEPKRFALSPSDLPADDVESKPKLPAEPWLKLSGETTKAFEAFVAYRDMGEDRSNAKVAQALGKSKTLIDRWSSRWRWVDRVGAFDREQDRLYVVELRRERKRAAKRHADQFKALQTAAVRFMQKCFGEKFELIDADSMTIDQLIRIFDIAAKGERLALGEPDQITEHHVSGGPVDDDDPKQSIPLTFSGRVDEALALLEAARARADAEVTE